MKTVALADVVQRIDYGLTTSAVSQPVGPRFLRITDIDNASVDWHTVPFCDASESEATKYALCDGDLVVARTGASTGRSAFIQDAPDAVFASYLVRFRANAAAEPRFLGYVLRSAPWHDFVHAHAQGKSAQPNMSASLMAEFQFGLPPLGEQRAIAEVLGALDDKIAANSKLVYLLDERARALYASLDHKGSQTVGELFVLRKENVAAGSATPETPYRGLEHLPNRLLWASVHGHASEVASNKSQYRKGDVLFGKLRPYFHKVVIAGEDGVCSTDALVLSARNPSTAALASVAVASDPVIETVTSHSEGTRMPRTNWKTLAAIDVPWPSRQESVSVSADLQASSDTALAANAESLTLAATRDALLPHLMSGRLTVRDAEKTVEDLV